MASTLQKTVALKVISAKNLPRLRRDPRVALFIGVPEVCGYTHGFRLRGLQSPRVDFGRGFSGGVPVPSAGAANPAGPEKVRDLGAAAESSGAAPRPSEGLPTLLFTSPPPEGSAPSPGSGPGRSAHHPLGALRCLWRGSESSPTGGPPGRWGHRLASATQRFQQRFRGLRHRFPLDWALVLALKREQPAGSGRGGRRPWP